MTYPYNKQLTPANEVRMFLELCAGIASIQITLVVNLNRVRVIHSDYLMFEVPLPVEASFRVGGDAPLASEWMPSETIKLHKLAWQWHTTPEGRRLHTIYIGIGSLDAGVVAWSRPEIHILEWRKWQHDR